MANRLEILKNSLRKKQEAFNSAFESHIDDVKSANGQPLNDKHNGCRTLDRWDRQNDRLRIMKEEIEKTTQAIEREESKLALVAYENESLPPYLLDMVAAGQLIQWRCHPNTFFVPGIDKGRLVFDRKKNNFGARYVSEIRPGQREKFCEIWRLLNSKAQQNAE